MLGPLGKRWAVAGGLEWRAGLVGTPEPAGLSASLDRLVGEEARASEIQLSVYIVCMKIAN